MRVQAVKERRRRVLCDRGLWVPKNSARLWAQVRLLRQHWRTASMQQSIHSCWCGPPQTICQ